MHAVSFLINFFAVQFFCLFRCCESKLVDYAVADNALLTAGEIPASGCSKNNDGTDM